MRIAVVRERRDGERRVALVPEVVARLVQMGLEVQIETAAGQAAGFADAAYAAAGATLIPGAEALWGEASMVLKVAPPLPEEMAHLRPGSLLIGFLNSLQELALIQYLAEQHITAFSMELIPRSSRAQAMDALSSQASVVGYQGALLAARALGKFFPMLTTAAGTIAPARVLVLGAGVAGLMAIATARRLGAVVEAFDIRPAVREEVQSLGATFIGMALEASSTAEGYAREVSALTQQREHEIIAQHIARADVVITTAQVPGKRAPVLVTEAMVAAMQPGSVLVDLAAEQGGNCACTEAGQTVVRHGVTLLGPCNIASLMPAPASQMYARNLLALVRHLLHGTTLSLDFGDAIIAGACVTHGGEIRQALIRQSLQESS